MERKRWVLKVIRKRAGQWPEVVEIDKDLRALQEEVDGSIDAVTIRPGLVIVANRDGCVNGDRFNCCIDGIYFFGTVIALAAQGEEFTDVPELDRTLLECFGTVRYTRADRRNNVWKCRRCGHLEQFEADGPYENGWNLCPSCGGHILRPVSHGTAPV